ncbi:DUF3243 domain-containing protein [Paenibacillus methanolicus]|uniref:Uncharacterized protein DUF3243 n=1 Tax=Paenibacillus methanolicus TaxID=582686 RepID=A0A5S5C243_9BACL|nr:DUF3243 domain-containing protein [Paenibacillus methanolicus]TYP72496.1 uncharacterized protein DUF3243 [Paenibacillus methanolicus]
MTERNHAVLKDGELQNGKIEETIERLSPAKKDEILADFEQFRSYLSKRVKMAEAIGLSEEQLAVAAQKVAQYLAEHEQPRNAEENLLQQLWKVGEEQERHALAHLLVKLAQNKQADTH